jgi:dienelactone hydrolase
MGSIVPVSCGGIVDYERLAGLLQVRRSRQLCATRRCGFAVLLIAHWLPLLGCALLPLPTSGAETQSGTLGLQSNVVFTDYASLSSSADLVRRLLSPLNAVSVSQEASRRGKDLREQPIDLVDEKFAVYVPSHAPLHGYSLLVFVPPWPDARVPSQWISTMDRHGMIFVSAAKSGNEASVLDRREPLALLAALNVMRHYPVDPQQVYIGGFSGGSRVALRIALGYPDVFHGALLNAGSDTIGSAQVPLPPAELLLQFQESTRLVYVTGEHDDLRLEEDVRSRQAMHESCVFDLVTGAMPSKGHELVDPEALNRSLDALLSRGQPDAKRLADCRARIGREMTAQLEHVEKLFASAKPIDARRLLEKIDARYGGLAAPRSIELAGK